MKQLKFVLILCLALGAIYAIWRANSSGHGKQRVVRSNGEVLRLADNATSDLPKAAQRYKLGVLFPFLASPFWVNEAYGVLDQAKKAGVDVVWLSADGYDNVDKQNSQMEDLVTQQVDAILLAATSYNGTAAAVDRATARQVPVFAHVTSSSSKNIVSAVVDDDLEIGRRQAEYMGTSIKGRGNVVMLNGPAAAEWSSNRVKGFKQVVGAKFPNINIVAERTGIPDRADAQRLTEDLLTTFPDLSGIFTVADGMAMGAADAIKSAGRAKKMTITTASFSRETIPYLQAGNIGVNVDENPVLMGRTIVNIAIRALNGEIVPATVYVPNPAITSANLNSVQSTTQWAPDGWRIH
jgi:ribose transport system substrate-binding protein